MISKFQPWVWYGSASLAFIAGMINAVGFLSFQHQSVTHLTGSTTLCGVAFAQGDFRQAAHLLAVIGSFLIGAIASGALIQDSTLKLGRRYGVALSLESVLLFAAIPLLQRTNNLGLYFASCAVGLQNGMASTYSGAVLRTSHVSGTFTDLGILIGHVLRGLPVDYRRLRLSVMLIGMFSLGAGTGAAAFARLSYDTLYFPAALVGVVGVAYSVYRRDHRRAIA